MKTIFEKLTARLWKVVGLMGMVVVVGTTANAALPVNLHPSLYYETARLEPQETVVYEPDYFYIEEYGLGASVAIDGDTMVAWVSNGNQSGYEDSTSYDPIIVFSREGDQWVRTGMIGAEEWLFGPGSFGQRMVDISGDYVAVGAANSAGGEGRVYVFRRTGSDWNLHATLAAPDAASGDGFGGCVALDGSTLAVGAFGDDDNGSGSGSVYVFARSGASWILQGSKLLGDPDGESDRFGYSLSLDGDWLVVGALGDDTLGRLAGAAYLFKRDGASFVRRQKLFGEGTTEYSNFGFAVALSGDRLVVGAPGFQPEDAPYNYYSCEPSGGAFMYRREGESWVHESLLSTPPQEGEEYESYYTACADRFGASVALQATPTQDTVVIGNGDSELGGGLHVFSRYETNWSIAKSISPQGLSYYGLGVSLDIAVSPTTQEPVIVMGTASLDYYDFSAVSVFEKGYGDPSAVVDYTKRLLYLEDADEFGFFNPENAAFRYKNLLYGSESNKVRARFEMMPSLYSQAERDRAELAVSELTKGLEFNPDDASLADLLLDVLYDRTVAETILAKDFLAGTDEKRLGPPSVPGGWVIDDEIGPYHDAVVAYEGAVRPYFDLLTDPLDQPTVPPLGYTLFKLRVPFRPLMPARYVDGGGNLVEVTDGGALVNGYKDLVLIYDVLRDYGQTVATLAGFYVARDLPGDRSVAKELVDRASKILYLHGRMFRNAFDGFTPVRGDGTGVAESMAGWDEALRSIGFVQETLVGDGNLLGFEGDFMMFVQKFTGQSEDIFDSYDALKLRIDPEEASSPLADAQTRRIEAVASLEAYRGFEDQLRAELSEARIAATNRLVEIVGAAPGTPEYETPEENEGSEINLQQSSIALAGLRIRKNQVEIRNLQDQVRIEIQRRGRERGINNAIATVQVIYGARQASLTREIGYVNAAQAAAQALADASSLENLNPFSAFANGVNAGVQVGGELLKGELEGQKERLAAQEQARITSLNDRLLDVNSRAQIRTWLLGMKTLVVDSQEAALLLKQEYGRQAALLREKADLEQVIANSEQNLERRYFADPTHRLRSQHKVILANGSFREAQKWLFFMNRAMEYKWNTPFANYNFGGKTWSSSDLFRLRNAEELELFFDAMCDYEAKIQLPVDDLFDWFSVREDFFGYQFTNSTGEVLVYSDPISGEETDALGAFRSRLRQLQDGSGNIRLDFSTVKEIPGGTFFLGPRFNGDEVTSKGLFLDKIQWLKINLPGNHTFGSTALAGQLTYGGTSFIRNFDTGQFNPDRPDRLENEMTAYSTRFWFFHAPSGRWRFTEALSSPVTMQLSSDTRVPPSVAEVEIFKERSVATTGWELIIPTEDLGVPVLSIDELDDVELYFYHRAATRP